MKMKKGLIIGLVLGLLGTAGVYATLNIDTTINNLYSYVKYLFVTSDGTANGTKNIILNGENGRIDAKSVYVNEKELATEEYVDNKASDTLIEAKNYTNTKANQTLSSAKSYTDSKANEVLNSAKSYADQKKVEAINAAKNYTNHHVVDGAHIAIGAITEDKLATDLKNTIKNRGFHLVEKCNIMNVGRPNSHGLLCASFRVTNAMACIQKKLDGVYASAGDTRSRCANGFLYSGGCKKTRHGWMHGWKTSCRTNSPKAVGFAFVYKFVH